MSEIDDSREILDEFVVESHERLDRLDADLIFFERDSDADTLDRIFRTFHTIKGTCGFLDLPVLERLTHEAEGVLVALRNGELDVDVSTTSVLLDVVDVIRELLVVIRATGSDAGGPAIDGAVDALRALRDGVTEPEPSVLRPGTFGHLLVLRGLVSEPDVAEALALQAQGDPRHLGELLVAAGKLTHDDVVETLDTQDGAKSWTAPTSSDGLVRVSSCELEHLLDTVGRLSELAARAVGLAVDHDAPDLRDAVAQVVAVADEVEARAVRLRLQPIESLWARFPRLVRDLAVACDKKAHVTMEGGDTEVQRSVLDAIKEPLTHLVRNSIDHGIETPEERTQAGKAPHGTVALRAWHEHEELVVELADDGRGLDVDRIRSKAVEQGMLRAADADALPDDVLVSFIFRPGFSTAERVTNVSGRGVGADVVWTSVEALGGRIEVSSEPGRGTTFRLRIPDHEVASTDAEGLHELTAALAEVSHP